MPKPAVKKTLVAILILSPLLLLSYCTTENHLAKNQADAICAGIALQSDTAQAVRVIQQAGIPELSGHPSLLDLVRQPHYSFPSPDLVVVSIPAAFGDRWACGARFKDGKVINKEVRFVD